MSSSERGAGRTSNGYHGGGLGSVHVRAPLLRATASDRAHAPARPYAGAARLPGGPRTACRVRTTYRELLALLGNCAIGGCVLDRNERLPSLDARLLSAFTLTTFGPYVPNGGNVVTSTRTEALLLALLIFVSVTIAACRRRAIAGRS